MKHITPYHMVGFNDELQKEAGRAWDAAKAVGRFVRSRPAKAVGALSREMKGRYGRQVFLGAGLGAGSGALVADPDEPGSRLRGAIKGGLIGGGLAGGAVLSSKAGRQAASKGIGNFYQRQRYSLTGKGLGGTDAERLSKARKIGLVEKMDPKKFSAKDYGGAGKAARARAKEEARIALQEDALRKGYMSAPGVIHGMLTRPGDVMKSGWKRGGTMGKLFAGMGAVEAGKGIIQKPEEGGPGRLEKGLRGAGSALGWMVAPTTLLGGQIIGMGGGYLGGKAGQLGDKAVSRFAPGRVAPAAQPAPRPAPRPAPQLAQGGY